MEIFEYVLRLLTLSVAWSFAVADDPWDPQDFEEAQRYLERFRYFGGPRPLNLKGPTDIKREIEEMQAFANIPITGKLDAQTMAKMRSPRCGVADFIGPRQRPRLLKKRYSLSGQQWSKKALTYSIQNYTPDLPRNDVRRIIRSALQVWADNSPLTFTERQSGGADIDIMFAKEAHGDGYEFDGPGGTLAHAYFPGGGIGGDAHFDDDEFFTQNTHSGTNLFLVAAHELGHSLGLAHSSEENSLMAPYYQGFQPEFRLPYDDVRGIQELYGRAPPNKPKPRSPTRPNVPNRPPNRRPPYLPPTTEQPTVNPDWPQWPPRRPEQPPQRPGQPPQRPGQPPQRPGNPSGKDLCAASFQATMHFDGRVYLFSGSQFWMMEENGMIPPGYPKSIQSEWIGAPTNMDAAITMPNENFAFFKGNEWWEFRGPFMFRRGRLSDLGLPSHVRRIDAATIWEGNNRPYFFVGNDYYRYNDRTGRIDPGYPRQITPNWVGVPASVSAAYTMQGFTYFVKGQSYYKFDNNAIRTVAGPRDFGGDMLGCRPRRGLLMSGDGSGAGASTAQIATVLVSIVFTLGYMLSL